MIQLEDRTAFVTRSGRGIGRGIVVALAQAGADIVIADVDAESAKQTEKDVEAVGRQACIIRVDVTDESSTEAGVAAALGRFDHIDILVNNAGVIQTNLAGGSTGENWSRCLEMKTRGTYGSIPWIA